MNPSHAIAAGAVIGFAAIILMLIGGRYLEAIALTGAWLGIIGAWRAGKK